MLRVGLDCDGVLSDFTSAYVRTVIDLVGRATFPEEWAVDPDFPPCWAFPQQYGYTDVEIDRVWEAIAADPSFWMRLDPLEGMKAVAREWVALEQHEVYFVTNRAGIWPKMQTEIWLEDQGVADATVLISAHKGTICGGLGLDCYLDDKLKNIEDVMALSPSTRAYLLDYPYNRQGRGEQVRVVHSVQEFLDKEGLCRASS